MWKNGSATVEEELTGVIIALHQCAVNASCLSDLGRSLRTPPTIALLSAGLAAPREPAGMLAILGQAGIAAILAAHAVGGEQRTSRMLAIPGRQRHTSL